MRHNILIRSSVVFIRSFKNGKSFVDRYIKSRNLPKEKTALDNKLINRVDVDLSQYTDSLANSTNYRSVM